MLKSYEAMKKKVFNASQKELILMMYDGINENLLKARESIVSQNVEQTHNYLTRAKKILVELMKSLDPSVGTVSKQLLSVYFILYENLFEANLRKETLLIDETIDIIRDLRKGMEKVNYSVVNRQKQHITKNNFEEKYERVTAIA
jgi:flagellar biosynthetic protein FliS